MLMSAPEVWTSVQNHVTMDVIVEAAGTLLRYNHWNKNMHRHYHVIRHKEATRLTWLPPGGDAHHLVRQHDNFHWRVCGRRVQWHVIGDDRSANKGVDWHDDG